MNRIFLILIGVLVVGGLVWYGSRQDEPAPLLIEDERDNVAQIEESPEQNQLVVNGVPRTCPANFVTPMTEGPYYTIGSPQRTDIRGENPQGERITLTGYVLDKNCQPIPGAWIDFWQTDGEGNYDNAGYDFRGHQLTDESGKYVLETVIPGEYPGRTNHIHVKLRARENENTVTTQLYFPGASRNSGDTIYDSSMLVSLSDDRSTSYFNFKLDVE